MKGRSQISVSDAIPCPLEPCSQLASQTSSLLDVKGNVKLSIPNETTNSCCIYNKQGKTNNLQLFIAVVLILLFPLAIKLLISAKFILDNKTMQISL